MQFYELPVDKIDLRTGRIKISNGFCSEFIARTGYTSTLQNRNEFLNGAVKSKLFIQTISNAYFL
jgi:hypothetical protein